MFWTHLEYDALGRVLKSGIIGYGSTDTITIPSYDNHFFYDQYTSENSQARLSINITNEYEYGEKYDYDARGRIANQSNIFDSEIDTTFNDSIYIERAQQLGGDTIGFVINRNCTLSYHLERQWVLDSNSTRIYVYHNYVKIDSLYKDDALHYGSKDGILPVERGDYVQLSVYIPEADTVTAYLWAYATFQKYLSPQAVLKEQDIIGRTRDIEYTYDNADQLTSITYPDGMIVTYYYDQMGRLSSIGDATDTTQYAQYSYTDRSEVATMILGDTTQIIDYLYNERGWLTSINGGVSDDTTRMFGENLYYYDVDSSTPQYFVAQKNGNIAGQSISINGDDDVYYVYNYDKIDRLTKSYDNILGMMSNFSEKEEFSYDKNGNRETYTLDGATPYNYTICDTNNQLLSIDTSSVQVDTFTYDDNGNLKTDSAKGITSYYDIYNQLQVVTKHLTFAVDSLMFGYNTDGQRVSKRYIHYYVDECGGGIEQTTSNDGLLDLGAESLDGMSTMDLGGGIIFPPPESDLCTLRTETVTKYVRSKLNNQVLAEYNGYEGTGLLRKYIYAGDKRIAMVDNTGAIFYYLNDHLGSSRVIVKEDGTIQDRYNRYLAFGGDDGSSTTLNNAYKYTGKPFDDEHGFDLFYYGARYYDPFTGRFAAIDPLNGKYPEWGPYVYTMNNPIRLIDPTGMSAEDTDPEYTQYIQESESDQFTGSAQKAIRIGSKSNEVGKKLLNQGGANLKKGVNNVATLTKSGTGTAAIVSTVAGGVATAVGHPEIGVPLIELGAELGTIALAADALSVATSDNPNFSSLAVDGTMSGMVEIGRHLSGANPTSRAAMQLAPLLSKSLGKIEISKIPSIGHTGTGSTSVSRP